MVEQGITPTTERNITRVFNYVNRHPMLWKSWDEYGAHATKWFIKEGKAPLNIGAIKAWTEAREIYLKVMVKVFVVGLKKPKKRRNKRWITIKNAFYQILLLN